MIYQILKEKNQQKKKDKHYKFIEKPKSKTKTQNIKSKHTHF